ncbi:unnamed protein product [Symbiodinium microadriaticum]|nr:unnamed protein product [Symbiodinium microadriaticum]
MQTSLASPLCNPGSSGHPFLCARPCVYMMKRGSCHVQECKYCHMNHDLPVTKLNQRQRYVLQRLAMKDKMDLLLAALRAGLHRDGLTDRAGSLLYQLEVEASMHPVPEGRQIHKRQMHDLRKALMRMTLNDNIKAFEDVLPAHVLQSFQDLRQTFSRSCDVSVPISSKPEQSLKEALALFPIRAAHAPVLIWHL